MCKSWNLFITSVLWKSKGGRKEMERKLNQNWMEPLAYTVFHRTIELNHYGTHPLLAAVGENEIVIGFENTQDLVIIHLNNRSMWKIETNLPNSRMRVYINEDYLLYCNDSSPEFGDEFTSTIFIVSTTSKLKELQEEFTDILNIHMEKNKDSFSTIVLILMKTRIEILTYNEERTTNCRFNIETKVDNLVLSNFIFPCFIISDFHVNNDIGSTSLAVWNYIEEYSEIKQKHTIKDLQSFVLRDREETFLLYALTYFKNCFFVSCSVETQNEKKFIVRFIKEDGTFLSELKLPHENVNLEETLFYHSESKLFIELKKFEGIESDLYMIHPQAFFDSNAKDLNFSHLQDVHQNSDQFGYLYFILNKVSVSSLKMNESSISLKQLNFWANH